MTQGETLEDLQENLRDLHKDLTSGEISGDSSSLGPTTPVIAKTLPCSRNGHPRSSVLTFLRFLSYTTFALAADGQVASSVVLQPVQLTTNFGQPVSLIATITPGATGRVTFYDGATVLGVSVLNGGQATFATSLLPSGTRYLRAHYSGDSAYKASDSSVVKETVVAQPSSGFRPRMDTPATIGSMLVNDFNVDGKQDLFVYQNGIAYVMLGNGDGTFQPTKTIGVAAAVAAIGDLNGDGKPDIVAFSGSSLSVLLGNGDGTFTTGAAHSLPLPAFALAIADFNGDGNCDLALSVVAGGGHVEIMFGNGDGTFQNGVTLPLRTTGALAVGDFNADSIADLVAIDSMALGVSVALGNGDGTFQSSVSTLLTGRVCCGPQLFALADFDNDGRLDLAEEDTLGSNYFRILLGNGNGTFRPPVIYISNNPLASQARSLSVGDFNGDGKLDLVNTIATGTQADEVWISLGNGDGTFQHALIPIRIPGSGTAHPAQPAVGEFNGDGKTDLAVFTSLFTKGFSVLLGGGCSTAAVPVVTSIVSASSYGGYSYFASGSWIEIKGSNLADPKDPRLTAAVNPGQWTSADFVGAIAPTSLDGVSVSVNGKPAYIWYISPGQLNVQAPEDSVLGMVNVTVTNCSLTSSPFPFTRKALAPGLLTPANFSAAGKQYLAATFASDGAYVLNTSIGAALGISSRPAKPGDLIIAYGIGFGEVTPSLAPGRIVPFANALANPVQFSFGSVNAMLSYAGLTPGFVGLYEFYLTVPSGLGNGDVTVSVTQNGVTIPQTLYLALQN
jgi:uncharacterized protein (TIGR03437 family)